VERNRRSAKTFQHIPAPLTDADLTSEGDSSTLQVEPGGSTVSAHIPHSLVPDAIAWALDFFFLSYCVFEDKDATTSVFRLLPGMYAASEWSSPLCLATRALAVNVTGLWSLRSSDITEARRLYSQAVTRVKIAVANPLESQSDELLLATQVLEAYETINTEYQRPSSASVSRGLHASGSMALLKHRAALNNQSKLARHIALAVRRRWIQDAITVRQCMEETQDIVWWQDDDGPLPLDPAAAVDNLAFKLFQLRRLWRLSASGATSLMNFPVPAVDRNPCGRSMLSHAVSLHEECTRWVDVLPDRWYPTSVHRQDVDESVKAAGMHGTTCHVYSNLSVASTWNWYRIIEFGVLQLLLHMRLGTRASSNTSGAQVAEMVSRMQAIVDGICASVPYCTGDITDPSSPLLGGTIRFPHVHILPSPSAVDPSPTTLPESISQHEQQLASSGAMLMHRTLTTIVGMAEDQDTRCHGLQTLHPGQVEWIKSQISRLYRALHPITGGPAVTFP